MSHILYTVTLGCGHKRKVRQEPGERMACKQCRKTRVVNKVARARVRA